MDAILEITDGSETVSLISRGTGYHLKEWTPQIPEPKGGGVFQSSALSDGRRLAWRRWDNVIDTFELALNGNNMDLVIAESQRLRRLLLKATDYWLTDWASRPVWIKARGSCETNIRYALIVDWRAQNDDNPYATPFFNTPTSAMDDITLIVEHEAWKDQPPGSSSCVEISNLQDWTVLSGNNLVLNPSFEDCIGLTCYNPAATVYVNCGYPFTSWETETRGLARIRCASGMAIDGTKSCFFELTGASGAGRVYQDIAVNPSTTYYLSFYLNGDPVWMDVYDNTGATVVAPTLFGPSPGWRFYAVSFTTSPACNTARIIFTAFGTLPWSGSRRSFLDKVELVTGETITLGSEETCENQVYISNKQNKANITHIFNYDASGGGSFSGNLMGSALPITLFPANPAAGDCVYFGIDVALSDTGPFFNLIFDIGTPQSGIDTIWEYTTGGGTWGDFTNVFPVGILDTTTLTNATGIYSFDKTGPGAVVWSSDMMSGLVPAVPSSSASKSASPSASRSQSPSRSASPSASPSASSSVSPSPSVISPGSASESLSVSPSASESPSTGASGSVSPSASPSVSPSVSPSASRSLSPSASASPSISQSASISPSASPSPSVGPGGGLPFFIDVVNGITGFWVRCRITGVSSPTRPTQQNRQIYTTTRPYVDIAVDQIEGDIPTLMSVKVEDVSCLYGNKVTRAIVGARSLGRGPDFAAYLNCADEQNPAGLTVTLGGYTTYVNDSGTPTGRVARFQVLSPTTISMYNAITFSFSSGLATQYVGAYRAILRCNQVDGSEDMHVRLGTMTGTASFYLSDAKPTSWSTPGSIDFGRITIPAMQEYTTLGWSSFSIIIYADKEFSDTGTLDFYDLILIPVDEWAGEFIASSYPGSSGGYSSADATDLYREYLDIDPISYPKNKNTSLARQVDSGFITIPFKPIMSAPPSLQTRTAQRVWFFQSNHDGGDWWFTEKFSITSRVQIYKAQQYLSMRGSG